MDFLPLLYSTTPVLIRMSCIIICIAELRNYCSRAVKSPHNGMELPFGVKINYSLYIFPYYFNFCWSLVNMIPTTFPFSVPLCNSYNSVWLFYQICTRLLLCVDKAAGEDFM